MAKRFHNRRHLSYCTKLAAYICEAGRCGEVKDRLLECLCGLDTCGRDIESNPFDHHESKLELGWIEDDTILTTVIQEVTFPHKGLHDRCVIQQGVIYATPLSLEILQQPV